MAVNIKQKHIFHPIIWPFPLNFFPFLLINGMVPLQCVRKQKKFFFFPVKIWNYRNERYCLCYQIFLAECHFAKFLSLNVFWAIFKPIHRHWIFVERPDLLSDYQNNKKTFGLKTFWQFCFQNKQLLTRFLIWPYRLLSCSELLSEIKKISGGFFHCRI